MGQDRQTAQLRRRRSVSEREELVEGVQHVRVQVLGEQQRLQRLTVRVHLLVVLWKRTGALDDGVEHGCALRSASCLATN